MKLLFAFVRDGNSLVVNIPTTESRRRSFPYSLLRSSPAFKGCEEPLSNIDRGVPEVFNSTYDVRALFHAVNRMRDGEPFKIPGGPLARKFAHHHIENNVVGNLLEHYGMIE